jgi:hypothetical protein
VDELDQVVDVFQELSGEPATASELLIWARCRERGSTSRPTSWTRLVGGSTSPVPSWPHVQLSHAGRAAGRIGRRLAPESTHRGARMPDLYLGVVCSECLTTHDLYNPDSFSHARGNSYTYTCPVNRRRVVVRVNVPDAADAAAASAARPRAGRRTVQGDGCERGATAFARGITSTRSTQSAHGRDSGALRFGTLSDPIAAPRHLT